MGYFDDALGDSGHCCSCSKSYRAAVAGMGAVVESPSAILAEMQSVGTQVHSLNAEVQANKTRLPDDFLRGWNAFFNEYLAFYGENEGLLARMWISVYDKTLEYRKQVNDWRAKFESLVGKKLNTPRATDEPPDGSGIKLPDLSTVVTGVALAVGAAIVLPSLLKRG